MNDEQSSVLGRNFVLAGAANSLIPKLGHPFFIVTPPYLRMSAGVTVLHLLCHYLNLSGESAFIVHYPPEQETIRSLPSYATLQTQREFPGGMLTPLITQDVLDFYDEKRLTPIVIYQEVFDNPFKASFFGRYILNYPGKFNAKYEQHAHFGFAYTKALADHCIEAFPEHPPITDVLFVPTSDLNFWNTSEAAKTRQGTCYYAGKMKAIMGGIPDGVPDGSVEIVRSEHMSRGQIRELFWKSEAFYCYEDTALMIEARLCGCPTVFVPNEQFSGVSLAFNELGTDGWCTAGEEGGLERAKATVGHFDRIIRSHMVLVPERITTLATKWKAMVGRQKYQGTISYPLEPRLVFFDRPLPARLGFANEDGMGTAAIDPLPPSPSARTVCLSCGLIANTLRTAGVRGLIKRVARGLSRHGIFGFARLLRGVTPDRQSRGDR